MSNKFLSQDERLDYLIEVLKKEDEEYKDIKVPNSKDEKKNFLRALMNIRMPYPISEEFLKVQDEYLKEEEKSKKIITLKDIETIDNALGCTSYYSNKISLWQGDITTLSVDAIVNAANSRMLGCFVPLHKCIDNAIHSAAGIQLRDECNRIMNLQGHEEPTGSAKITSAYNLPSKYVIHTVGPIVQCEITEENREDLKNCYKSCLEIAVKNNVKSIAFCCISTGEFRFPNEEAANIAIEVVKDFIKKNKNKIDRIIFNVFKDIDYELYIKLLK